MTTPESRARQNIDAQLTACGWVIQDRNALNLYASRGVAVREFPMENGYADYLLFVDRSAAGVVEAKAEGVPLAGVAEQAATYAAGLPADIPHVSLPLPFIYESTGIETFFRDDRDPQPRSRRIFAFHRPETLADWLNQPDTLRTRLCLMPEHFPLITDNLWPAQVEAIRNLERSFAANHPRENAFVFGSSQPINHHAVGADGVRPNDPTNPDACRADQPGACHAHLQNLPY